MSEITEHEWAAMAEYSRQQLAERRAKGDRSVPGHSEAESSLGLDLNYEPADYVNDLSLAALVRLYSDQGRSAADHAAQFDNTDEYGLALSRRLDHALWCAMERIRAREWHCVAFDDGENWSWHGPRVDGRPADTTDYSVAANNGAILGVVMSHMLHRNDNFIYAIAPGSVPKWLEYVDRAGWRFCCMKKCEHDKHDYIERYRRYDLVVARHQWLFDFPVCGVCLKFLRYEVK